MSDNHCDLLSTSRVCYKKLTANILIHGMIVLTHRKKLFEKAHHFVHLNLAISLLLANTVFVIGAKLASQNEV